MDANKVKPFDSFSAQYRILIWAGFYRLLNERNNYLKICHRVYRPFAFLIVIIYNLQNLIFVAEPTNATDLRLEGLMFEVPQLNLIAKVLTVAFHSSRIDKINDLLDGPIFAANGVIEEELLQKNVKEMRSISKILNVFVTFAALIWPASNILRRIRDNTAAIPLYVPFKTDTWTKYIISCLLQIWPFLWVGYGHITLDCLVVTYYAQAQVQLKIIKHNLTRLFDTYSAVGYHDRRSLDTNDKRLYTQFVSIIKHYEKIAWYTKEVNSIFNPSISFQFLTSSISLCIVIYEISKTSVLSVQFVFLSLVIGILLTQVFMYCYYGNLVRYESETINTSLYLSGWTSATPRFRRALLIAMSRWSKALATQVAGIIPLALDTFVSIIRLSYTLYTVLSTKHDISEISKKEF